MKARPILFQGAMVRALLDDSKTQTRRALKLRYQEMGERDDGSIWPWSEHPDTASDHWHACPYGQPGDQLWVRETWRVGKPHDKTKPVDILPPLLSAGKGVTVLYEAGGWRSVGPEGRDEPTYPDNEPMPSWAGKGRPSIHIPRAFSRIQLEIVSVRVERLQAISEEDARAEGVTPTEDPAYFGVEGKHMGLNARESYANLWEAINGAGSWDANPWVWVVEFKRVAPC